MAPSGLPPIRVLLVDDQAVLLRVVSRDLMPEFEITPAATVAEALRELATGTIDVIIADYDLRDEHTGLEVLSAARASSPKVGRLLLTGAPRTPEIDAAIADGTIQAYLTKPHDPEALRTSIEAHTRRPRSA